ncbi:MAG: hypothetical protein ACI92E_003157 [Oceanicoccus sp.]|jgi:hypothetical protein
MDCIFPPNVYFGGVVKYCERLNEIAGGDCQNFELK